MANYVHPRYSYDHLQVIQPERSDEILINPGMGFETYERFNGDATETRNYWHDDGPVEYSEFNGSVKNEGHPDTSIAYFRWYWARLEPEEGKIAWDIIDRAIGQARKRGQQLHLRLMPHDQFGLLPAWYVKKGRLIWYKIDGKDYCIPDYNDPLFHDSMEKLVSQAGERYDGHPLLYAMDIGTLGFWGEWHNYQVPGQPMGNEYLRRWAVDIYLKAFKKTPLIMLIGCTDALRYAVANGAGWRADSWGDIGDGKWSHMRSRYPMGLGQALAQDAWKRGPVCLEPGDTLIAWYNQERKKEFKFILDEALRWHASLIMVKSTVIPEEWRPAIDEFQKKIGYRFTAGDIRLPVEAVAGRPFLLEQNWTNRGVAPCYNDFRILVRLTPADSDGPAVDVELPHNLKNWMPGDDQFLEDSIPLPDTMNKGPHELRLAIVRPGQNVPAVKMANAGRDADGWLHIGEININ